MVIQWLRLHTSTAGGMGLIPDWGTKILHARVSKQKKKKDTINGMKRQTAEWEKIFKKYISDKELILGMFKELLQLNNNNNQKKTQKSLI